jgi:hypothetical protein
VVERPVAPRDLLAGIYERLGIDPDGPLPNEAGVDATVLPASKGDGRLKEIMPT